jgi:hypothetical protein
MPILGDPLFSVSLPRSDDIIGLRFSVYGKCDMIKPGNAPTIVVTVYDDKTEVTHATAELNLDRGTFEAFFDLPAGTKIEGTGRVVVSCTDKTDTATAEKLTIVDQNDSSRDGLYGLFVNNPQVGDGVLSWAAGLTASGKVSNSQGKTMYLRMTDRGFDLIPGFAQWTIGENGNWESTDLTVLVPADRVPNTKNNPNATSFKCGYHVSVYDGGEKLRLSSGFFSVTAPS